MWNLGGIKTPNSVNSIRDCFDYLKTAIDAVGAGLGLGETSTTAYRGDHGKTAYDHSQLTTGNPHGVTKSDLALGSVPDVDCTNASNISTGVLDIARIPPSALETLHKYTGLQTAPENFGLATTEVQSGDTIKVENVSNASNGLMWMVTNDAALSTAASFEPYSVGSAASVPWSGVTSKPATISDIAALAVTAGYTIVGNGANFVLQLLGNAAGKNVGTGSGDVAAGDKGLPAVGGNGQVLTVVAGVWQSETASGGGGSSVQSALIFQSAYYVNSYTMRDNAQATPFDMPIYNTVTGLTLSGVNITLPVGVYLFKVNIALMGAGRLTSDIQTNKVGGSGTLAVRQGLSPGYTSSTSSGSITTTQRNEFIATVTVNTVDVAIGTYNNGGDFAGASFTGSSSITTSVEIIKLS